MSERTFTYDELAAALNKTHEATRAMCIRKRWRRTIGNDGKARITVPVETVEAYRTPDAPRTPTVLIPERTPDAPQDAPAEPSADARALVAVLEARIGELQGRVADLDAEVRDLRPKAARVDVVEALLAAERQRVEEVREVERQRVEEWKAVADRFASQAEKMTAAAEARRTTWWPWRRRA
jgi:hypothetical protein